MDFEGIFDLFHLNQMDKAMDLLKKTNVTEKNKLQYTSTEMMILNSMEKYEQSIELGEKIWESDLTSENEFLLAIYYIDACISLSKIRNVSDKFGKLENKVVSNKREQISKFVLFRFYHLKGTLLLRSGELDEAMEITKLNQDLISQIPDHQSVNLRGIIHLRLGTIFDYMGKLQKATELYHKSEQEFKNNANQKFLMKSYQNLGNIYRLRGLIDDSIKYYTLSEEISQRQNDTIQMAQMSIERGVNFVIKGDIPKAL